MRGVEGQRYERLVTMIDIELESNAVATSLPDPVSQSLTSKMAELTAIQECHERLEAQLGANEEVERYLRA